MFFVVRDCFAKYKDERVRKAMVPLKHALEQLNSTFNQSHPIQNAHVL